MAGAKYKDVKYWITLQYLKVLKRFWKPRAHKITTPTRAIGWSQRRIWPVRLDTPEFKDGGWTAYPIDPLDFVPEAQPFSFKPTLFDPLNIEPDLNNCRCLTPFSNLRSCKVQASALFFILEKPTFIYRGHSFALWTKKQTPNRTLRRLRRFAERKRTPIQLSAV